jgi:hypothetical protein
MEVTAVTPAKIFGAVLGAILSAGAIIGFVLFVAIQHEKAARLKGEVDALTAETRSYNAVYSSSLPDNSTPSMPAALEMSKSPKTFHITIDTSVFADGDTREVKIPAGTVLEAIARSGHDVRFKYQDVEYSVPAAITDLDIAP